jgi:hypothetical protein
LVHGIHLPLKYNRDTLGEPTSTTLTYARPFDVLRTVHAASGLHLVLRYIGGGLFCIWRPTSRRRWILWIVRAFVERTRQLCSVYNNHVQEPIALDVYLFAVDDFTEPTTAQADPTRTAASTRATRQVVVCLQ